MLFVGNSVKSEHGDFSFLGLSDGGDEVLKFYAWFGVKGLVEKEGFVFGGVERLHAAGASEAITATAQDFDGGGTGGVAGVAEARGAGNLVSCALGFDVFDIGGDLGRGLAIDALVVAGVIADFEARFVEFFDLLPSHVLLFIGGKIESFGDEEGGIESEFFEEGGHDGGLAGYRVIESEDDDFFGDSGGVGGGSGGRVIRLREEG